MRIVNKMMVRDFFLYGFVSTNLKRKMKEAMSKLPSKTTEHIRAECKRYSFWSLNLVLVLCNKLEDFYVKYLGTSRLFSTPAAKSHFQGNLVGILRIGRRYFMEMLDCMYMMSKGYSHAIKMFSE